MTRPSHPCASKVVLQVMNTATSSFVQSCGIVVFMSACWSSGRAQHALLSHLGHSVQHRGVMLLYSIGRCEIEHVVRGGGRSATGSAQVEMFTIWSMPHDRLVGCWWDEPH